MNISYISDLHLDFHVHFIPSQEKMKKRTEDFVEKLVETDRGSREVLCIAGDLSHFNVQSEWAVRKFADYYEKVVIVVGNHDYYLVSNNQQRKYDGNSTNRVVELSDKIASISNVHLLHDENVVSYKGVSFGGCSLWYPLESFEQRNFFYNSSNDSRLIKGFNIESEHDVDQEKYSKLLDQEIDVMITHFPVINIDSHFKYNSTACYLTPVKDIKAKAWIFGHSHEQKVYKKPYCNFYMNAIGYPDEKLELSIKSFKL